MEVARDVVNLNKAVLLPAGTVLTQDYIRRMKMWGVDVVHVVDQAPDPAEEETSAGKPSVWREMAALQVQMKWRHVDSSDRATAVLREMGLRRIAARLARSEKKGLTL